ncbi:MAG: phosphopantothenoylcysteine synthase [Clostridiales bacterium]|nr:phosphopantothenoylcysteine synthase [Clostridiales bacterium]
MNILVTSGGTTEQIDQVRSITNTSTGRLCSLIAEEFGRSANVDKIFYVCSETALRPLSPKVKYYPVRSVNSLVDAVTEVLTKEKVDVIIHGMAVSDYRTRAVSSIEAVAEALKAKGEISAEALKAALDETSLDTEHTKISSDMANPMILMEKTPKVISLLRGLAPEAVIVGFKLLNDVPESTLLDVAHELLQKNDCDYVLANDLRDISGDRHVGYLLNKEKKYTCFATKQEIAAGIFQQTQKHRREAR